MPEHVRVALYGSNGHQIHRELMKQRNAAVIAFAGVDRDALPVEQQDARSYPDLDAILGDPAIQLVSLCSPLRSEQANDAVRCLRAGKHVYADKPSATSERDLDSLIAAAQESGCRYHEQALTAFMRPYRAMRRMIQSGVIGDVTQVFAQKSYPWHDRRPQDERIDGGLLLQAGVYCTRFVEHVAGAVISEIQALESTIANPDPVGNCRRAVSLSMRLRNGGLASGIANYFCPAPPNWHHWGYETLRVWGTNGFIESIDSGRIATLAVFGAEPQSIDLNDDGPDLLSMVLAEVAENKDVVPFSLEEELRPTRWVIRAKTDLQR